MSALATVRSAFGPNSTLYTVLGCAKSSSLAELKRAYRKAALRYHPDRCTTDRNEASTLKFQAVSAAYQVLMDEGRRAVYDSTGRIVEEEDGDASDDGDVGASHSKSRGAPRGASQRQWEQFFHSVFDEIITTGAKHAATATFYRGSEEERKDVLHYYAMCKGDIAKVVECVVHGSPEDVVRWNRDIVLPAINAGEIDDYNECSGDGGSRDRKNCNGTCTKPKRRILEDSSSEEEEAVKKQICGKKMPGKRNNNSVLVDTDDEGERTTLTRQSSLSTASTSTSAGMSKRDKMDYRVAKKRKARAKKDMEIAGIIQSKSWGADVEYARRGPMKNANMGGISEAFLSDIERKYGGTKRKKR